MQDFGQKKDMVCESKANLQTMDKKNQLLEELIKEIKTKEEFDLLFPLCHSHNRIFF